MNSIKLLSTIVVFISIVTINGELITLDGQCPSEDDLNPDPAAEPKNVKGMLNIVEQTSMNGELNTTDGVVLLTPDGNKVNIIVRSLPKSGGDCTERQINLTYTGEEGVFNVSYQAQPGSRFKKGFKGYILQLQQYRDDEGAITVYSIILFICRNISSSKYRAELVVYSVLREFTPSQREDVTLVESVNDILDLDEYLIPETQNEQCDFVDPE